MFGSIQKVLPCPFYKQQHERVGCRLIVLFDEILFIAVWHYCWCVSRAFNTIILCSYHVYGNPCFERCISYWNRTSVCTDCFIAFLYGKVGFHNGTSLNMLGGFYTILTRRKIDKIWIPSWTSTNCFDSWSISLTSKDAHMRDIGVICFVFLFKRQPYFLWATKLGTWSFISDFIISFACGRR